MGTLRTRNKVLLLVLAALCALALALGVTALAPAPERVHAEEGHTSHDGWTPLTETGGTLSGGEYYLNQNITLTNDLTFSGTVTLCLNGYKLTGTGSGSVITVNSGTFTLCDCQSESTAEEHRHAYYISDDALYMFDDGTDEWDAAYQAATTEDQGTITGGVITGGNTTSSGGGIYMNGITAELILQGGTIAGNYTKYCGGGVHVEAGKFTMNGGAIKGNSALNNEGKNASNAVYVRNYNASFTMNGGEIAGSIGLEQGKIAINSGSFDSEAKETLDDMSDKMSDKVTFAPDREFVQGADGNYTLAQAHKHDDVSFTEFTTSSLNGDDLPAGNYYLTEDMQGKDCTVRV